MTSKSKILFLLLSFFVTHAQAAGVACNGNINAIGQVGGQDGTIGVSLVRTDGQETYELNDVFHDKDGAIGKFRQLAKGLTCTFSKIDPIVATCHGAHPDDLVPTVKIEKVIQTSIDTYHDNAGQQVIDDKTTAQYKFTIEISSLPSQDLMDYFNRGVDSGKMDIRHKPEITRFEIDYSADQKNSACKLN